VVSIKTFWNKATVEKVMGKTALPAKRMKQHQGK
jgi:hypothetical protein